MYTDTLRDNLPASDELKSTISKMTAFFSAKQQTYAACLTQLAAFTENSVYNTISDDF